MPAKTEPGTCAMTDCRLRSRVWDSSIPLVGQLRPKRSNLCLSLPGENQPVISARARFRICFIVAVPTRDGAGDI